MLYKIVKISAKVLLSKQLRTVPGLNTKRIEQAISFVELCIRLRDKIPGAFADFAVRVIINPAYRFAFWRTTGRPFCRQLLDDRAGGRGLF